MLLIIWKPEPGPMITTNLMNLPSHQRFAIKSEVPSTHQTSPIMSKPHHFRVPPSRQRSLIAWEPLFAWEPLITSELPLYIKGPTIYKSQSHNIPIPEPPDHTGPHHKAPLVRQFPLHIRSLPTGSSRVAEDGRRIPAPNQSQMLPWWGQAGHHCHKNKCRCVSWA